jgi:hypothetical protein
MLKQQRFAEVPESDQRGKTTIPSSQIFVV